MRHFLTSRLPSLTLLLIIIGLLICAFGIGQEVPAQITGSATTPREVARLKPALSLDNVFKALRSDKAPLPRKNQILIQAVKERGISFTLTTDVEEELTEQGAAKALIEAIRKETAKLLATSFFYRERGDDLRFKKNYAGAIENYNKTIELDPTDKVAYNNRGQAFEELKRYDEALADFTKVIEIDPTDRNGYHNRGVIYYNLSQYEKAIADYNKSIEIDPKFVEAYLNRASAYQMMGRRDLAEADRRTAKSLRP